MLKNISLPLFHRRGMSREGGSVFTTQFHLSLPPYLRVVLTYLFCFFSSRRRHTSLTCDWSSDVCSSDLVSADAGDMVIVTRPISESPDTSLTPAISNEDVIPPSAQDVTSPSAKNNVSASGGSGVGPSQAMTGIAPVTPAPETNFPSAEVAAKDA